MAPSLWTALHGIAAQHCTAGTALYNIVAQHCTALRHNIAHRGGRPARVCSTAIALGRLGVAHSGFWWIAATAAQLYDVWPLMWQFIETQNTVSRMYRSRIEPSFLISFLLPFGYYEFMPFEGQLIQVAEAVTHTGGRGRNSYRWQRP